MDTLLFSGKDVSATLFPLMASKQVGAASEKKEFKWRINV